MINFQSRRGRGGGGGGVVKREGENRRGKKDVEKAVRGVRGRRQSIRKIKIEIERK